jgi:hypothetical protein
LRPRCMRNVCKPRRTPTDRRHLAQMHTPAEGGASPEGPLRRSLSRSLSFSSSLSLSLSLRLVHRGRCSFTTINLPPRRRRFIPSAEPPLASDTDRMRGSSALR